jgi:AAA+ ATPase superfamily predicted ATPase
MVNEPQSNTVLEDLRIERGLCHVMFAYDAARSINLDEAGRRLHETSERHTIPHKRRAPSYFEYRPPPLLISYESEPLCIGSFQTRPTVDLLLYDFGALAAGYTIALDGPFDKLLRLSEELYDNAALLADSRKRVELLLKVIGDAATYANLAPVVEDYIVFHVESLARPIDASRFCTDYCGQIAQILRAERRPLSDQEAEETVAAKMSYGADDLLVVDWNAALLIDREGDDVREVLQFANVELLEMRYLDQKLDGALDRAYETLSHKPGLLGKFGRYRTRLRALAELQVDNATLFEGVNNALKLLGDQYLARAYRLVSRRLHLDDWDTSILRKLQTLDSIYQKLSDQAATRRMEVLEWVIIILFVFSIILEIAHFRYP